MPTLRPPPRNVASEFRSELTNTDLGNIEIAQFALHRILDSVITFG